MEGVPEAVLRTLEEIKKRHKNSVSLAKMKGCYYVMETTKRYVEEKKRQMTYTLYLGRIQDDGTFIEALHRKKETKTTSLESSIKMKQEKDKTLADGLDVSELELKILTSLSTDARKPISTLAKELGISTTSTSYHIKKLEKKYGIEYVCEVGTGTAFGLSRFIVNVKFIDEIPNTEKVKTLLSNEPLVHLAMITKGEYDLFFVVLAVSTLDLENWLYKIRNEETFASYRAIWNVSSLGISYGYIPLREQMLSVIEKRVWHKSRDSPVKQPGQLLEREYSVLKELNTRGVIDFTEIDRKYNLADGSAQYTYHKLLEKGIINRITITMNSPPVKYIAVLHLDQLSMSNFIKTRKDLFIDRISSVKMPIDKYVLTGDSSSPYGILVIAPVTSTMNLEKLENNFKELVKGIKIRSLVVTDVIVGKLGFRKFDNRYTRVYDVLKNEYNYSEEELTRLTQKLE